MSLSKNKIQSFLLATLLTCLMIVNPLSLIGAAEDPPAPPDTPGGSGDKPTGAPTEELGKRFDFFDNFLISTGGQPVKNIYRNPATLVYLTTRLLFIFGGVVFFFLILFYGFKIAFANDKKKILADSKQYLTTGIIGLVLMFAAYWIVEIVGKLTKITMPLG